LIAELLISTNEDLELPPHIQRKLEESSQRELYNILHSRDELLLKYMTLQVDCDRQWEKLPNDIRVLLVKRVVGEAYDISENQISWIESSHGGRQIPYDVLLARHDLHASLSLLIDDYAASLLRDPGAQKAIPLRREIRDEIPGEEPSIGTKGGRRGVLWFLLRPVFWVGRMFSTSIKFMSIALVAEPEFQRELAYLTTGTIFRRPLLFLATLVWRYARLIQGLLLPPMLVWSLYCSSNYSITVAPM